MAMPEHVNSRAPDPGPEEAPSNHAEPSATLGTVSSAVHLTPGMPASVEPAAQPGEADSMTHLANDEEPPYSVVACRPEFWIDEINVCYLYSSRWLIKVGELLIEAKGALGHGKWMSMFGKDKLPFGLRTAEMFMRVARHPILSNRNCFSNLPVSWAVLYLLSGLSPDIVEEAIRIGDIHPELGLREARRLLQSARSSGPAALTPPPPPAFDLDRQVNRVCAFLKGQLAHWPLAHRGELAALLETLAAELRAE
jgi:hypothetical protein